MNLQTKLILPAEWSFQDAILLCWPHSSMDWQPILKDVEPEFEQIAFHICQFQRLIIIAQDKHHQAYILDRLDSINAKIDNIQWLIHKTNDTWCRDFAPVCVKSDHEMLALNFEFNGWGNKYPSVLDNSTNDAIKQHNILKCSLNTIPFVLEGGSIDTDGLGTLLTTKACLLSEQRNPSYTQFDIEQLLLKQLGSDRIIWIENGYLSGDDTDSHIDNLARFCNTTTIAYASCEPDDEHYPALSKMENELKQLKTKDGNPYQLIPLKIPLPIYDDEERLAASYVNFLITNDLVLVPTFNDKQDAINIAKLQDIFIERTVIGIDSRNIIKQSGSIHCLTMQLPQYTISDEF